LALSRNFSHSDNSTSYSKFCVVRFTCNSLAPFFKWNFLAMSVNGDSVINLSMWCDALIILYTSLTMCFPPPFFLAHTVYAIAIEPCTPALCTACMAASLLMASISSTLLGIPCVNAKHITAAMSPSSSLIPYIFLPYACLNSRLSSGLTGSSETSMYGNSTSSNLRFFFNILFVYEWIFLFKFLQSFPICKFLFDLADQIFYPG